MAITYVNNIHDYIVEPLEDLLEAEFTEDIGFGEHIGIEIIPNGDELVELRGCGQIRDYSVSIIYSYNAGVEYQRDEQYQHLSNIGERIKRLIWNNTDGSNWFDGKVDSIEYEQDEEDRELFRATLECAFSREEVI